MVLGTRRKSFTTKTGTKESSILSVLINPKTNINFMN